MDKRAGGLGALIEVSVRRHPPPQRLRFKGVFWRRLQGRESSPRRRFPLSLFAQIRTPAERGIFVRVSLLSWRVKALSSLAKRSSLDLIDRAQERNGAKVLAVRPLPLIVLEALAP